jgi:hypothetical protein
MTIPASETARDILALRLMTPASISSPTKNKNRQRPMFATKERYGLDSLGNMCSVNPGTRPNAVGPSKIPPKVSQEKLGIGCSNRESYLKLLQ